MSTITEKNKKLKRSQMLQNKMIISVNIYVVFLEMWKSVRNKWHTIFYYPWPLGYLMMTIHIHACIIITYLSHSVR